MSEEVYTTGGWTPNAGEEAAFVEAWVEFAGWASQMPGAGILMLAQDNDEGRFLSFGRWRNFAAVRAWKAHRSSRSGEPRAATCRSFLPAELAVVATADAGSITA